jgi:hypothetical protein
VTITGGTINGVTIGGSTPAAGTFTTLTANGNTVLGDAAGDSVTINGSTWNWAGSATRLQADFSTATIANRAYIQTSTTNGETWFGILPNGTATATRFSIFNSSDPTNSSRLTFAMTASGVFINSTLEGTGTSLPVLYSVGGVTALTITAEKNIAIGAGQVANNATDGFLYIPTTTSGAPTGTPTVISGLAPMVVDDTNSKLYINIGGTWKSVTLT